MKEREEKGRKGKGGEGMDDPWYNELATGLSFLLRNKLLFIDCDVASSMWLWYKLCYMQQCVCVCLCVGHNCVLVLVFVHQFGAQTAELIVRHFFLGGGRGVDFCWLHEPGILEGAV